MTQIQGTAIPTTEEYRSILQREWESVSRVLAGLSVAFDASCEEMWLAWRHGACLVPAPRSLVRSGMDLGPWLTTHGITVVSTVPTLAALWPAESLENVRLLIFGGEACPPELGQRLAVDGREVWNTYGPTEATVIATGAVLTGEPPVRIGLPLPGWELAIVDTSGNPVRWGEEGELIIGGDYYDTLGFSRDPAYDQYLGGSATWALGELPMVLLVVVLLFQWFRDDDREAKRRDRSGNAEAELAAYNAMLARAGGRDRAAAASERDRA